MPSCLVCLPIKVRRVVGVAATALRDMPLHRMVEMSMKRELRALKTNVRLRGRSPLRQTNSNLYQVRQIDLDGHLSCWLSKQYLEEPNIILDKV